MDHKAEAFLVVFVPMEKISSCYEEDDFQLEVLVAADGVVVHLMLGLKMGL